MSCHQVLLPPKGTFVNRFTFLIASILAKSDLMGAIPAAFLFSTIHEKTHTGFEFSVLQNLQHIFQSKFLFKILNEASSTFSLNALKDPQLALSEGI